MRGRRARPVSPTTRHRKSPLPILIVLAVIVFLIFCWVFGKGCGGNKEAKENEELREYTSSVNKLIKRSEAVGVQFDNLRNGVKEQSKEDINRKLSQMKGDCEDIAKDAKKIEVPEKAATIQPLLQLCFDLRAAGVGSFGTALSDILDEKNVESATDTMGKGLIDLLISDEVLARYRESLESKLKAAKVSYEQVAGSSYLPKQDDALASAVHEYVDELGGTETGSALHGVAVVGLTTSPARIDRTESGVSILPYSKSFTVKVTVQNQGNQEEEDIPVVVTLTQDSGGTPQKDTQKIARLKPDESTTVIIEKLKPAKGSDVVNTVTVKAGPVKHEKKVDNNVLDFNFIMRSEED